MVISGVYAYGFERPSAIQSRAIAVRDAFFSSLNLLLTSIK